MKKEFSRILGIGLVLVLLTSLIVAAAPVSAGTLKWGAFTPVPSETNQVLEPGANITDLALYGDGDVIYAAGGQDLLYKSTDTGKTWSAIDFGTKSSGNETDLVAVAPDDADIVAVADTLRCHVWVSTDAGTTWGDLEFIGITSGQINDIDISAESGGKHYVALAGEDSNVAEVWTYDIGAAAPTWKLISAIPGGGFWAGVANSTAAAVAYSPNFPSDQVLAVVTEKDDEGTGGGNADYVKLELFSENQDKWNSSAGFDSYAATIVEDVGIDGLTAASIALDPEYLGSDDAMRMSFVGLTISGESTATEHSGIHRMDDTTHKALKEGTTVDIYSVAFDGSTVVAGRTSSNAVWYCLDPLASSPSVKSTSTLKRPGGQTAAVVAWAGVDLVAGTSGDESAFALSRNNGKSFVDLSLVDTNLTYQTDVAVSSDGAMVYMATSNNATIRGSVWRYASAWERVLSVEDQANFIVRTAPDDPDVAYVAVADDYAVYYTADGGRVRWQQRTSRYPVQDLAVEGDGSVAYVLLEDDGEVSKSPNAGFTWNTSKSSKLDSGYMLVSLGVDELLVGSKNGYVSFSTDGGDSFTKIARQIDATSANVSAIATGLGTEDYIYAGLAEAGMDLYRWQIGVDDDWASIKDELAWGVSGIALQDGVLYAQTANASDASMTLRSLDPNDAVAPTWSEMDSSASFVREPQSLKVSGGSTKLWAIDDEYNNLYSYTDTLAIVGPTLVGPATGFEVKVNPVTGYASDVTFSWEKPSAKVTDYEMRLAFDTGFKEVAKKLYPTSTSSTVGYVVGKSATGQFDLMPGETYYWKVRVTTPVYSPWSVYRHVTVVEAKAAIPEVTVEAPPAPQVTVTPPPAPQVTVQVPPAPTPVVPPPAIPAYLLWLIVGIGAVLIIALIILTIRTRRVV